MAMAMFETWTIEGIVSGVDDSNGREGRSWGTTSPVKWERGEWERVGRSLQRLGSTDDFQPDQTLTLDSVVPQENGNGKEEPKRQRKGEYWDVRHDLGSVLARRTATHVGRIHDGWATNLVQKGVVLAVREQRGCSVLARRTLTHVRRIHDDRLGLDTNWVEKGVVLPVRKQRGSTCFAVASTDVISSCKAIHERVKPKAIATQEILDCTKWVPQLGGSPFVVFDYVQRRGIALEEDYPYTGEIGWCKWYIKMPLILFIGVNQHYQFMLLGCALVADESVATFSWVLQTWLKAMGGQAPKVIIIDQDRAMKIVVSEMLKSRHFIDGFAWIAGGNEEEMLRVVRMQPIVARIICPPSLGAYKEGIYRPPQIIYGVDMSTVDKDPDFSVNGIPRVSYHTVMICGAGTYRREKVWYFKNSWGENFGMRGYGLLPRDGSFGGVLGVNFEACFPIIGPRSRYGLNPALYSFIST
ncbi:hypothetical protein RHGRI_025329 [Rhododendron griersonianum]|uniref:Protein FAR1-RELATED SEQUENCE n=2 Tax=Rhododendron griersonianum TaxID=479676 RepID=A0AAV6IR24_9ERIC|nr:hypothetical protein RHGRI_025329 [Rhododendron griersonianum]